MTLPKDWEDNNAELGDAVEDRHERQDDQPGEQEHVDLLIQDVDWESADARMVNNLSP